MNYRPRAIEMLLVEDNPGDVRLIQEALNEGGVTSHIHLAGDGEEAMQFLRRESPRYSGARRPDLILLDLNLPRKSGQEVLEEIKTDPALRRIPVMVLTGSCAPEDLDLVYRLHGNCYIRKPASADQFAEVVRSIGEFWFTVATLPSR